MGKATRTYVIRAHLVDHCLQIYVDLIFLGKIKYLSIKMFTDKNQVCKSRYWSATSSTDFRQEKE